MDGTNCRCTGLFVPHFPKTPADCFDQCVFAWRSIGNVPSGMLREWLTRLDREHIRPPVFQKRFGGSAAEKESFFRSMRISLVDRGGNTRTNGQSTRPRFMVGTNCLLSRD